MLKIFKHQNKETNSAKKVLKYDLIPVSINFNSGKKSIIKFENNKVFQSACVSCLEPSCMRFDSEELCIDELKSFPRDQSDNVCPVSAIKWSKKQNVPVIDKNKCISCGLCAIRCPAGAISFDSENKAEVSLSSEAFEDSEDIKRNYKTVKLLIDTNKNGSIAIENPSSIKNLVKRVKVSKNQNSLNYYDLLARNLLIALGYNSCIRRRGDVYIRMDGIMADKSGKIGVIEVENDTLSILDAPRNIMDDVAVLSSRYKINKSKIFGVIICNTMPNQRTEYWRVIDDIKKILDIEIYTITIPALIILAWNFRSLDIKLYSTKSDSCSIRNGFEKNLDKKMELNDIQFLEAPK